MGVFKVGKHKQSLVVCCSIQDTSTLVLFQRNNDGTAAGWCRIVLKASIATNEQGMQYNP